MALSSNRHFDALNPPDQAACIKGYVDEVTAPAVVGPKKEFELFKFVITNGNRRMTCLIWHKLKTTGINLIDKYKHLITVNKIIHIDGAFCKSVQFASYGLMKKEFVIGDETIMEFKGDYSIPQNHAGPIVSTFADVDTNSGVIKITGWMKTVFLTQTNKARNTSARISSITDEEYKLNVSVANYKDVDIGKGTKVTVTGVLRDTNEGTMMIECAKMEDIVPIPNAPVADQNFLDEGVLSPKRKREMNDEGQNDKVIRPRGNDDDDL